MSSGLSVKGLRGGPGGREIVKGVDLTVAPGEVIAVMGPNGSGKSTLVNLIMGRPGYDLTAGEIEVNGQDVTGLAAHERALAGLFLAFQYPTELPGIRLESVARSALDARAASAEVQSKIADSVARIGFDATLLERGLNEDFSGGEKKRAEVLQMDLLRPEVALLDEIDSGLDVDALRSLATEVARMSSEGMGVLLITHYQRLLEHVEPSAVHVFVDGEISRTGGPELALELESAGYLLG